MPKKVLVVDDSPSIRQQVTLTLSLAGFLVVEAVDGGDGLQQFQAESDISVVVCDVNRPKMNGIELVEKIHKVSPVTPILMLTTEGQPASIEAARKAGAKGWIVKPFKAELFVSAVRKLAGQERV